MIPRAALYALLLFLGSALWNWVPPLLLITTGWKVDEATWMGTPVFSSPWIQTALIVYLAGVWVLLFKERPLAKDNSEFLLAGGGSILFLYLSYNLLSFQDYLFRLKSQAASFDNAAWVFLAAGLFFLALLFKAPRHGEWALGAVFVFLSVLVFFSVHSFPLSGGFSNMILAIEAWGRTFLHGESPYRLKIVDGDQVPVDFMPGVWLAFLPALLLNLDLRYWVLLYLLLFAFLAWRGMESQERPLGSWLLVLFLLNPWALFRQDVYLSVYLLSWGGFFLALRREHWGAAACCFGWGLSAHPFSWALLPVWTAWNVKRRGWRDAGKDFMRALGVAFLFIIPFVIWDPQSFFQGTLFTWTQKSYVAISHFGLATWLSPWPGFLKVLAFVFLGAGTWGVWRGTGSLESLFCWLTLTLSLALLVSYHIEHYYYFVPLALMLFHEIELLGGQGSRKWDFKAVADGEKK